MQSLRVAVTVTAKDSDMAVISWVTLAVLRYNSLEIVKAVLWL